MSGYVFGARAKGWSDYCAWQRRRWKQVAAMMLSEEGSGYCETWFDGSKG